VCANQKMDYLALNQLAWDKRTKTHLTSDFYDVTGFINGNTSLNSIELNDVGNVEGKRLLHLQCHFGLDSLSWARLGAQVTGVDLSPEAIEQAKGIAAQTQLKANFICADVYAFGEVNDQAFDIVFTSYGALCWLPDLDKWAQTIAKALVIGGQLNVVEFHPFNEILSGYSYFYNSEPDVEEEGTYTENCTGDTSVVVTWAHPLSNVINALIKAGISIEQFSEYPYSPYNCLDNVEQREDGNYYRVSQGQRVPLVYSIVGKKIA